MMTMGEWIHDMHVRFSHRQKRIIDLAIKRGYAANATEFMRLLVNNFEARESLLRSSEEET